MCVVDGILSRYIFDILSVYLTKWKADKKNGKFY